MIFTPGQLVTVEFDEDQQLHRRSCNRRGRVLAHLPPFVIVDIDEVGPRGTLDCYVQPWVTQESLAARLERQAA